MDAEGCLVALAFLVALSLLALATWLMAEFVVPLLFLVAYFVVSRDLRHVINDTHACQGHAPRALLWGTLWATIYTAPLAAITVGVHLVLLAR